MSIARAETTAAGAFTGEQFERWPEADQRGYVSTQLVMASTIAARIKPPLSDCIADAFFASGGMTDEGFVSITGRIAEFDSYHPSSVILVVIESECGAFN